MHKFYLAIAVLTIFGRFSGLAAAGENPQTETVIRVAQDGTGDFNGKNEKPILAALAKLGPAGGTVEIAPGTYSISRAIRIGSNTTLRGLPGAVLQLPEPVQTEKLDDQGKPIIEGVTNNLIVVENASNKVTIEGLIFDGGLNRAIKMPGHSNLCGIWVHSSFSYADGPKIEPTSELTVRNCIFRNFYGRGIAMYNVVDSTIIGCLFENIDDEAIDFDHFSQRCRAEGNEIRGAVSGITINDASDCLIRYNRIQNCNIGINIWWWHMVEPEGVNVRNTIEYNFIRNCAKWSISLGTNVNNNIVRRNFIEGGYYIEQKDTNTFEANLPLKSFDAMQKP